MSDVLDREKNEIAKGFMREAANGKISLLPNVYIDIEQMLMIVHDGVDHLFQNMLMVFDSVSGRVLNTPVKALEWGKLKDYAIFENGCGTDFPVRIPYVAKIAMAEGGGEVPCLFIPIKKPGEGVTEFHYVFIGDDGLSRLFVNRPEYCMDVLEWEELGYGK